MKVTVCFGAARVVVPCGDGELLVKDLIEKAVWRYRKATGKRSADVVVYKLKNSSDGILDAEDKVKDVVDDREQIIAVYDIMGGESLHLVGDGTSGSSSVGTSSPDPPNRDFHPPNRDSLNQQSVVTVTMEDFLSDTSLSVQRCSDLDERFEDINPDQKKDERHHYYNTSYYTEVFPWNNDSPSKCGSNSTNGFRREGAPYQNYGRIGPGEPQTYWTGDSSGPFQGPRLLKNAPSNFEDGDSTFEHTDRYEYTQQDWQRYWDKYGHIPAELERRRDPVGGSDNNAHSESWMMKHSSDSEASMRSSPGSPVRLVGKVIHMSNVTGPLGMHLVPACDSRGRKLGLVIQTVELNSRVCKDGRLDVGDRIIEINGTSLIDMDFERCKELFRRSVSGGQLQLFVVKSAEQYYFNDNNCDCNDMQKNSNSETNKQDSSLQNLNPRSHNCDSVNYNSQFNVKQIIKPSLTKNLKTFGLNKDLVLFEPGLNSTRINYSSTDSGLNHSSEESFIKPVVKKSQTDLGLSRHVNESIVSDTSKASLNTETASKISHKLSDGAEEELTINLIKGSQGLGFSVTTRDNPIGERKTPVHIKNILPQGAAVESGLLKPGDELVKINGADISDSNQTQVVQILRDIPLNSSVELTVKRKIPSHLPPKTETSSLILNLESEDYSENPYAEFNKSEIIALSVKLNEMGSAGLGISVKRKASNATEVDPNSPGVFVKAILAGGAAAKDGRLKIDDQILEINRESLLDLDDDAAMLVLKSALVKQGRNPGFISVVIARRKKASENADGRLSVTSRELRVSLSDEVGTERNLERGIDIDHGSCEKEGVENRSSKVEEKLVQRSPKRNIVTKEDSTSQIIDNVGRQESVDREVESIYRSVTDDTDNYSNQGLDIKPEINNKEMKSDVLRNKKTNVTNQQLKIVSQNECAIDVGSFQLVNAEECYADVNKTDMDINIDEESLKLNILSRSPSVVTQVICTNEDGEITFRPSSGRRVRRVNSALEKVVFNQVDKVELSELNDINIGEQFITDDQSETETESIASNTSESFELKPEDKETKSLTRTPSRRSGRRPTFQREGFGRQSMSEKRKGHLDPRQSELYQKIKQNKGSNKYSSVSLDRRNRKQSDSKDDSIVSEISPNSSRIGPSLRLKKSTSLESLQTVLHDHLSLISGGVDDNNMRIVGNYFQRNRGCNNSFRAAVDRSYEQEPEQENHTAPEIQNVEGRNQHVLDKEPLRKPGLFSDCHRDSSTDKESSGPDEKKKCKIDKSKNIFQSFSQILRLGKNKKPEDKVILNDKPLNNTQRPSSAKKDSENHYEPRYKKATSRAMLPGQKSSTHTSTHTQPHKENNREQYEHRSRINSQPDYLRYDKNCEELDAFAHYQNIQTLCTELRQQNAYQQQHGHTPGEYHTLQLPPPVERTVTPYDKYSGLPHSNSSDIPNFPHNAQYPSQFYPSASLSRQAHQREVHSNIVDMATGEYSYQTLPAMQNTGRYRLHHNELQAHDEALAWRNQGRSTTPLTIAKSVEAKNNPMHRRDLSNVSHYSELHIDEGTMGTFGADFTFQSASHNVPNSLESTGIRNSPFLTSAHQRLNSHCTDKTKQNKIATTGLYAAGHEVHLTTQPMQQLPRQMQQPKQPAIQRQLNQLKS